MPHCVIECPAELAQAPQIMPLMQAVHQAAVASGLFETPDIKVRVLPSAHYLVGGQPDAFVHVTTHILAGRSEQQKKQLADAVARAACAQLPQVAMITSEVRDIQREAYSNRRQAMAG
ncbi:5-carboxymethyl-2-hydroxymuconate Delta-isomerase [Chromobacterium subtsugae]|uniref:5-carboxymethyl-2-hydroxymuconate Delta-isomerase n=1 Tax=Chromobacterium subtsugae TaxID=251747 RepID=A0ABS7FKW3_9NEIS|nr:MULTISPECIES: 5-carboxymethyl-2-hydroxymuconate Delta-isomerase [Chromobacterium]KUM02344.1 hypothetical protein Cv017_03645 [Chromobacterium subtsugae]KZE85518.1 hypothetical protein AWB61_19975 [Chromobacterium sp. F49]MBW7568917.1 5-carboxymethyl-2-hydroxymuconate Delta-isomerase [Chromobacterium subtsugae]MBW8289963.1 5-carboxymethyl-2-hydroxymuconate Delta-isomerase [Chromobacterium subtsugae]OBU84769.1 hypothetical protein MY55_20455 [Chromobacterium subtsugae]